MLPKIIKDPTNPTFDEIADIIKGYLSEDEYNAQILKLFYSMPSLVLAGAALAALELVDKRGII
ncbi:hypothetical protein [Peribacillus sp. NPDC058075]|uniref:hypothetical protein n=1 Tax=unclassified Peribacillus TaxID=2675266 RepID=UPI0036DF41E0